MFIILEGPDGVGKTTLADALKERIRADHPDDEVTVYHSGPPELHPLDEYVRAVRGYRPGTGQHIICDRWHWGEFVYPRITGRKTRLDVESWWYIERYLARLGAVAVLCTASDADCEAGIRARGEDVTRHMAQLHGVRSLFHHVFNVSRLPTMRYSWRDGDFQTDMAYRLASYFEGVWRYFDSTTYVGPRFPKALLFGDVRKTIGDPRYEFDPAFVPFPTTSGHYLIGALGAEHVGLANACDVDDPVELWTSLGRPPVVALGRNASRRLTELRLPHGAVPHPQYVRRFHHARQVGYGELITQTLQTQENNASWPSSSKTPAVAPSTRASSVESSPRVAVAAVATVLPTT